MWRGPQGVRLAVVVLLLIVSFGFVIEGWHEPSTPKASFEPLVVSRGAASELAPLPHSPWGTLWRADPVPTGRIIHAMAYDSASDRVILFGGSVYAVLNDTWVYDFKANAWTDMDPATKPTARAGHAMAYDSGSDRVILFGGTAGGNDTWAYDFNTNTWTDMNPVPAPSPRIYHTMAYDSASDRVILFGGYLCCGFGVVNDTWAYDFETNTWTDMNPVGAPPSRYSSTLVYDSESDRAILFGGNGYYVGNLNDTWAYDFKANTWTDMNPSEKPSARYTHAMAYDTGSDRAIVFSGYGSDPNFPQLADTWAYDFNANTWTSEYSTPRPVRRAYSAMAYDSGSDRVILFSGSGTRAVLNDTWAYDFDANTWTSMDPKEAPPARYVHAMAYDSGSDRVILFSGYGSDPNFPYIADTWAYDFKANRWTDMDPAPSPSHRTNHAMVYDSRSDRLVMFGGAVLGSPLNDTWAYDFETDTWTDMNPVGAPPARYSQAMAYDSQSDRMIMFGGQGWNVVYNDTWAYDFKSNTWTNMTPAAEPPARSTTTMAYDAQSDRVILFGGLSATAAFLNDTWAYDFGTNTWTEMDPVSAPLSGYWFGQAMAYDSASDRVVVFGPYDVNNTWTYDFDANMWTNMDPVSAPSTRYSAAIAYDSGSDRVVLFGGYGPQGWLPNTWAYDLKANTWTNVDIPVPLSAPHALSAASGNSQVTLIWQAPASDGGSPITGYDVYRGTVSGSLTLLSSLGDVLTYQDAGLTNGVTYYYQVSAVTAAGEGPRSSEVAVTPRTQPSGPRNLVATPGAAQVVLTWDAPISDGGAAVTGYSIYRGTAPASSTFLASVGNVLTYADDAATIGVTYYYQVAALNIAGEGPRSNEVSATPTAAPDSTPPTATIGSLQNNTVVNSTTITLTGTASDNVAIEKVEVSTDGTTWIPATGTTSWSATLTLGEGQNTIFVRTTDTSGNVSITTITVTVAVAPLTPQGTPSLAVDRVAGGAVVTAAVVVGVYVSSSVASGASGVSTTSGGMTHKGMPLPWKRLLRFLRRRKRGAEQLQIHDRLGLGFSKSVGRPSKVLGEAATSLGLRVRGPWLFGRLEGFPVVAKESGISDRFEVLFQVALTPEATRAVTTAISDKERLKSLGLRPAGLRIEPSVNELVYDHRPIVRTKPADIVRIFEGLAVLASEGGPALGDRCEKCRQKPGGDVVVVNGLPTQLCAADFEAIRVEGEHAEAVAKGLRPSYAKGVGLGLVGMFLGAGIWAAIGIVTGYALSLAAFGISVIVARLLAKGAGRVTLSLAALMSLLTMLAIFLGDVLWVGVVVVHVRGPLDLGQAVEAYLGIVRGDPFVLLSYPSGFVGILVSIASLRRRARRARAFFEVIS